MARNSIKKSTQAKAGVAERRLQRERAKRTTDSFQNFALKLGIGTDNPLSSSTYGFNPVTRIRTLLEWMHRGSWMGGIAVDIVADDMTRAGIDISTQMDPKLIEMIEQHATSLNFWGAMDETIKWARLYGGCIMVPMIDGQDPATPLRVETIMKGQLKSFLVLDRWMVEARLEELVGPEDPDVGDPMYYRVNSDAPALRGKNIHHSRVFRMLGLDLPYWQRVQENLWGLSVFERLYDRMVALDSSTQGAAQLVYKSFLRTYKMDGMTDLISQGGDIGIATMLRKMEMVTRWQSNEGMTVIDAKDDITTQTNGTFAGIGDVILQMAQQMSGTLQIPLVRMFGQSPAGLNSSGESDLRTYYDGINTQQNRRCYRPVHRMYRIISQSAGAPLPADFSFKFTPLWQLDEGQKSEISARDATSVAEMHEAQLIDTPTAMRELKQNAKTTSRFDNITDEAIEAAELQPDSIGLPDLGMSDDEHAAAGGDPSKLQHKNPMNGQSMLSKMSPLNGAKAPPVAKRGGQAGSTEAPSRDRLPTVDWSRRAFDALPAYHVAGVQVSIENMRGTVRQGPGYRIKMPADYGHIPCVDSAEGDMEWMDAFVGPERDSEDVWVIDSVDPRTGQFDEHKCMMGFGSKEDALDCFAESYHDGAVRRMGGVTHMDREAFGAWLRSGDHKRAIHRLRAVT